MARSAARRSANDDEVVRAVRAIYAEWEKRPIERQCIGRADCCRFRLTGRTPYLTQGEALLAARSWRAAGRKDLVLPADGSCPFLHGTTGKCQIYDGRPFACRTHFCEAAGGPASRKDVRDLIQRLEEIDCQMGGQGPVNLASAVRQQFTRQA